MVSFSVYPKRSAPWPFCPSVRSKGTGASRAVQGPGRPLNRTGAGSDRHETEGQNGQGADPGCRSRKGRHAKCAPGPRLQAGPC
uniref:Uncharacterized protein n=1 Tax=Agrobacterium tumefaciens TaxID=358 RepID=A0A2Z2PPY0_AGRTU|nr:hypothetical protein [Agrobacterium radiobacter]